MRLALKFAYDGIYFHGYARQPNLRTVEGDIIDILIKEGYISNPKTAIFRSASRTDKNVSAMANVVAFNTSKTPSNVINTCNALFDDIIVYGMKHVNDSFYPRHAKKRVYEYYLKKNAIDHKLLKSVVKLFIGTHDFSNFARIEAHKDPFRTVNNIIVKESIDFYVIEFHAQTFLWHQIRRMISSILKVGNGSITINDIIQALHHPAMKVDFGLASAEFLILSNILYDFSFDYDIEAVRKQEKMKGAILKRF